MDTFIEKKFLVFFPLLVLSKIRITAATASISTTSTTSTTTTPITSAST